MSAESEKGVQMPVVAAFAATRALAGFGLGLLMANRLAEKTRRTLGFALLGAGAASTVPLLWHLKHGMHHHHRAQAEAAS